MIPANKRKLESRVRSAAEAALADQHYVSAIDVLCGMGSLTPANVARWRRGQLDFLERIIQGNLRKISMSMSFFRQWAQARGLKPSETRYVRRARSGTVDLRFSKSGDPKIEKAYRTHFVSPALSDRKQEKLQEKLNAAPQITVFAILRDSRCSECGTELLKGNFLRMEAEQALCLPCANLEDLEYLPRGDAALTRRAGKYSRRSAIVVRFSRTRGRYERQGILVDEDALGRAEEECKADAPERAQQRAWAAAAREAQDEKLVKQMTNRIRELFPGCPADEARSIASHTVTRGSGRVGRTAAGRALNNEALTWAVAAAVRHTHTRYDKLLAENLDRTAARAAVTDRVEEILGEWRAPADREK